jgi:hypothetical protein
MAKMALKNGWTRARVVGSHLAAPLAAFAFATGPIRE